MTWPTPTVRLADLLLTLTEIHVDLGVTLSSDATSVRGENYEGAHVMINKGDSHKMRILSLTSTVSHSSETQLENLKKQISNIADTYRRSPLGQ
jgi:hypothetical protein